MTAHAADAWSEHRCVTLTNPEAEFRIDRVVLRALWPGVEQALRGSGFTALCGDGDSSAQTLETLRRDVLTRSLTFVIDSPERPAAPLRWRPWFCRFVVEASVEGYMLHKTTILSFPEDFAMAKLTRFLREPLMQGCPPELSWCEGIEGPGGYSIALNSGGGAGWGLHDEAEARAFIRKTVEDHLEVISAMDRLATDWNDDDAFDALHRRATDANIAC